MHQDIYKTIRKLIRETIEQEIEESSLNRIHSHFQGYDIAILTAFRDANIKCTRKSLNDSEKGHHYTKQENLKRNRLLKQLLQKYNYGVTKIDGSFIENFGSENQKEVKENSFLVVNYSDDPMFEKRISDLGERFCQDSVIIKLKDENAIMKGTNYDNYLGFNNTIELGKATFGKEAKFMSRVKNRPFHFKQEEED